MRIDTDAERGHADGALGAVRALRSNDLVAHANSLSAWQQQYDQLSAGAFKGALEELWFEDVQVFQERTSHALRQVCRIRQEAVWCGVTLRHDGSRIEGQEVGPDGVMVCGRGQAFELMTPDGHEIFGIVASRKALLRHADALGVALDAGRLDQAAWLPCGSESQSRLRHCLAYLLREAATPGAAGAAGPGSGAPIAERARRRAQQAALDALLDVLSARALGGDDGGEGAGFGRRRQLVRSVCAHLQRCPDEVPTVPELCAAFHVSRRTLQYAFEHVVGASPVAYLRSLRLNAVRRDIASGAAATVHDAAARQGFWSLSQFAGDYRRLFGERPSQTQARARRQSSPAAVPTRHAQHAFADRAA